jgi:ribosomal protein S27AE
MERPKSPSALNDGVLFSALEMIHCGAEILNGRVSFVAIFEPQTENNLGITSLFAGVEQLLKFRLQQTHWSLVFADVNKATVQAYHSGDFVSVSFSELVKRIKNISHIALSNEDVAAFETLGRVRNRGMHYNSDAHNEDLAPLYSRVLSAAIDFTSQHIQSTSFGSTERNRLENLRRDLSKYKDFLKDRNDRFKERVKERSIGIELVQCPLCLQDTLFLDQDIECGFCGVRYEPCEVAVEYYVTHSVWGLSLVHGRSDRCAKCGEEHLFEHTERWICFTCKSTWDKTNYARCEQCLQIVGKEDMDEDEAICQQCMAIHS